MNNYHYTKAVHLQSIINEGKIRTTTVTWAKFKHIGGITEISHNYFTEFSEKMGCKTNLWNCSLRPISQEYFESIEMLVGNEWIAWDGEMTIADFVNTCHRLNTNQNVPEIDRFSLEVLLQTQFYLDNEKRIIQIWEQNNDIKGFLEFMVSKDYKSCRFNFVKGEINNTSFLKVKDSLSNDYVYLHVLWSDTKTKYMAAMAYNRRNFKFDMFGENLAA